MRTLSVIVIVLATLRLNQANFNDYYPRYDTYYPVYSYYPSYSSSSSYAYSNVGYNSCSCSQEFIARDGEVEHYAMCCRGHCPKHLPSCSDTYADIMGEKNYAKVSSTVIISMDQYTVLQSKTKSSTKTKANIKITTTEAPPTTKTPVSTKTTTESNTIPPIVGAPAASYSRVIDIRDTSAQEKAFRKNQH
ncbi:uncharacterized protein LOC142237531 [Haematobia irritans]|uniref:uncharacterized protein LOC142237531 n=1 Tax=Haematobia irritans TaxID=7368 RepID=UPI003F4FE3C0